MCGRYVILNGRKIFATTELLEKLEREKTPYLDVPRYNVSPVSKAPIVVNGKNGLQAVEATWWLIPHWSKTGKPDMNFPLFNARGESIDTSKLFAPYFKAHRCLVPADGFYEWKRISAKEKHPMCIRMKDEQPMFFGGIYSIWKDAEEKEFPSYTIITTEPNKLMGGIHDRMPVILPAKHFEQWLDPSFNDVPSLKKLLVPYPAQEMNVYRVSNYVSNVRNQGEECMLPFKE
jgi:putative SOS response-associated peptidase YedK